MLFSNKLKTWVFGVEISIFLFHFLLPKTTHETTNCFAKSFNVDFSVYLLGKFAFVLVRNLKSCLSLFMLRLSKYCEKKSRNFAKYTRTFDKGVNGLSSEAAVSMFDASGKIPDGLAVGKNVKA